MFTIIGGDGQEYGPVTADQVRAWVAAGRANLDTRVRRADETEWRRLEEFPELAAADTADAPPLVSAHAPLARRTTRLAAAGLDFIFSLLCFLPAIRIIGFNTAARLLTGEQMSLDRNDPATAAFGLAFLGGAFVLFLVQAILLTRRGQSLGKLLLRIRIVRFRDGARAGFTHAVFLRGVVPAVISWVPVVGRFFSIVDVLFIFGTDRRCLHDLIADTKVVQCDAAAEVGEDVRDV